MDLLRRRLLQFVVACRLDSIGRFGELLERVFYLFQTTTSITGQHMHKTECALDALVVVVLGQEAHLTRLWQLGHLEGQLRLRLLHVRAEFRLYIVVQLVRLFGTAPDAHLARVVDSSSDQTAAHQESAGRLACRYVIFVRKFHFNSPNNHFVSFVYELRKGGVFGSYVPNSGKSGRRSLVGFN